MIFQAHSKGLRLVVKAGNKEIDKSAGIPIVINHPQDEIRFDMWRYETQDEERIEWLKKHRMFSDIAGAPGTFWIFIEPRNYQAELEAKAAELEALKASLAPKIVSAPTEIKEEAPAPTPAPVAPEVKAPWCDSCASRGAFHKKDCPKNPKTQPVVA